MKDIGGYFELELNKGEEYHKNAIKLNLGRAAFGYILKSKNIKRVYIPWYTCDVITEPVIKLGIEYRFYGIDSNLEMQLDPGSISYNDFLLYINYFGIKDHYVEYLSNNIRNLIIDNSQSFYTRQVLGVSTFYSPRKFFGIPDGAYLYCDSVLPEKLGKDNSSQRFDHLIGRIENGAEHSYQIFRSNEKDLNGKGILEMSNITDLLLQNVNYAKIAEKRLKNFQHLHKYLNNKNLLHIDLKSVKVPMVYPFWTSEIHLRKHLIHNKVFVAQYWPNVLSWTNDQMTEYHLAKELIPLPVDQRYDISDMEHILALILND